MSQRPDPRAVYSSPHDRTREPRRNSPRGSDNRPVRSGGAPAAVRPGAGASRNAPHDQFSHIQEYWKENPTPRMQSVEQKVLLEAQKILRETSQINAPPHTCGQGSRFKIELALLSLQPHGRDPQADVMKTLFHYPVEQTMFEVPQFSGPLRLDSIPKWVMTKRNVPTAERQKVRYDLNSPWFDPINYPTWPENIRACYAVLETRYLMPDIRSFLTNVGLPLPEIRIAVGAPFADDKARPLTLSEFQNIAIAIVHFENQFRSVAPVVNKHKIWGENPKLQKRTEPHVVGLIQRTKSTKQLSDLLNPPKGGPWMFEFTKSDSVAYAAIETVISARDCVEKLGEVVSFLAVCLQVTTYAEIMAHTPDESGFHNFIRDMEAKYRPTEMDGSRFCQPTFERLSSVTPEAPARGGGFLSRIMPRRSR